MRKLASIQKIWDVVPIENADAIELVRVLGWQCIAKKGEFNKGDLCIYFEIDSFLPVNEHFEFLRARSYRVNPIIGEGFLLKTAKMRGQVSQGLCLPLSEFGITGNVGDDVTERLGVKKWVIEERVTTGGTTVGKLPYGVPHTDETRIQSCPELLNLFSGKNYYITTKCDGSSHSIYLDDNNEFHVTGHNYEYKNDGKSSFYEFINKIGVEERLRKLKADRGYNSIVLQGEFCGAGIQRNRLKLQNPDWFVFTVIINHERVGLHELVDICKVLDVKTVPIDEVGDNLTDKYKTVDDLLKRAEIKYPNGGNGEGIVIRTTVPEKCGLTESGFLSFKVINNKYLLKNGE